MIVNTRKENISENYIQNYKQTEEIWKIVKSRIYKNSHGCHVDFGNIKQTITITYP